MPTSHQKRRLSPIAQRMAGDMRVRNLAQRTIDSYTSQLHERRSVEPPRVSIFTLLRGCIKCAGLIVGGSHTTANRQGMGTGSGRADPYS